MASRFHGSAMLAIACTALSVFTVQASAASPGPYGDLAIGFASIGLPAVDSEEFGDLDLTGVESLRRDRRATGIGITLGWRWQVRGPSMNDGRWRVASVPTSARPR